MSVYYNLYLKGVLDLAATMVIKSDSIIQEMNDICEIYYGEPPGLDPRKWKYYMNLAGEYHVLDEPMTVVSFDTLQEIPFTRENLAKHNATRREYRYGSRYYKELVDRFPLQEFLIRGILNPVEKDFAIDAPNYSILYYDRNLVESQEITFIPELQERISWFITRYEVEGYHKIDTDYSKAFFGVLISFIIMATIDIRLNNCKTQYAHSFDVKQYLKSNGRLDKFYDHMTQKQRMFFYRNIKYIHHHNGKDYIFNKLMDRVLTDRKFPLAAYDIEMNSSEQLDNLLPEIQFHRKSLNGLQAATGLDIKEPIDVLEMEIPLAVQNRDEIAEELVRIPELMKASFDSTMPTKLLESNVMDTGETEPNTLSDVLLNHWAYLSSVNWYNAAIRVDNPKGGDPIRLFAKDAFVLWMYCMAHRANIELTHIPEHVCQNVRRRILPTHKELRNLDPDYVMDDDFIQDTLDNNISLSEPFISVESFKLACIQIHARSLEHIDSYRYQSGLSKRGISEMIARRPYMDIHIKLYEGMTYDEWFSRNGIDVSQFTDLEMEALSFDIVSAATGVNIDTAYTLREIHTAMIKLLQQLLSYSVQVVQQINSGNVMVVGIQHPRFDFGNFWAGDQFQIKIKPVTVFDYKAKYKDGILDQSVIKPLKMYDPKAKHYRYEFIGMSLGMWLPVSRSGTIHRVGLKMNMRIIDKDVVDMSNYGVISSDMYKVVTWSSVSKLINKTTLDGFKPLTKTDITKLLSDR